MRQAAIPGARRGRTVAYAWDFGSSTPSVARRAVARVLSEWRIERGTIEDAVLIASEIATNAIKHVRPSLRREAFVQARASLVGDLLTFEIVDPDPAPPRMFPAAGYDEHHRGLAIVDALAKDWGHHSLPDGRGKVVWWTQLAKTGQ